MAPRHPGPGANATARKARKKTGKRKAPTRVSPVPRGYHTVTPYIVVDGAARAIEFYKKAFGAKETVREGGPDGRLMHAEIKIGDSTVMLSDDFPEADTRSPARAGATTVNLHIYSRDVDRLWAQAIAAGAKVQMPLENQFWGQRYGKLVDPFGHIWSVSMQVAMSKTEMEAKRQAAMAMFEKGEHPGTDQGYA